MDIINVEISRFDPEKDTQPQRQRFERIEFETFETVLDLLIRLKNERDPSLTFRYSCQCTICGSCAMHINGASLLACKTKLIDIVEHEWVRIEALPFFQTIRDLVVDIEPMIEALKLITPWLVRDHAEPLPEREYIVKPEAFGPLLEDLEKCILCGICQADSMALSKDRSLVGPIAMVKCLKRLLDPRDGLKQNRLAQLVSLGLLKHPDEWQLTCPKEIDMNGELLGSLKKKAYQQGLVYP